MPDADWIRRFPPLEALEPDVRQLLIDRSRVVSVPKGSVIFGVGKPPGRQQGADYVLRRPSAADVRELEVVVAKAADAVEALVDAPVDDVMNRFNG